MSDVMIGKIVSYSFFGIGVIVLLVAATKLHFYDAEENGLKTLTEGEFKVDDGNEGYRIYTMHDNCEEVNVELYYESFLNMGELLWDPSCTGDFLEFRSASSGDWNYLGTVFFDGRFASDSNEITVNFNVSASHEVMITDREPIEDGLQLRTISLSLIGVGGLIFAAVKQQEIKNRTEQISSQGVFQDHIASSDNQGALDALEALKKHIVTTKTSHIELFSSFDLNNDGSIDHFELMSGLKSVGIEGLSPFDIDALVSLLDLDGDGKIDLHELGSELDQGL